MTLVEFLLARIAEDEGHARAACTVTFAEWVEQSSGVLEAGEWPDYVYALGDSRVTRFMANFDPARVLAECEAKRRIIEWHGNWPVLLDAPDVDSLAEPAGDLQSMTITISRRIAWLTEREYVARFGSEAPTGPVLRMLAQPYAAHPDFQDEWRLEPVARAQSLV